MTMTSTARALLAAMFITSTAAACGDDLDRSADGGVSGAADASGGDGRATAFAVGTDFFSAGIASSIGIPGLDVVQNAVDGVASTDPVVRTMDGRIYIVNRFGADNVTVLDATSLQLVAQISTGAGSNPQDVAADGDRLYVPTLAGRGVVVLDLARPDEGVIDTIDLSALDEDGEPNCHSAVRVDRRLAVVCGILNERFRPRRRGLVAVIDLDGGSEVQQISLEHRRPFGFALALSSGPMAGDILVPTAPKFLDPAAAGCIERVHIAGETPAGAGCLVDNEAMGGFAAGLAAGEDDRLWIAVTTGFDPDDYGPIGYAAAWDAEAGALAEPLSGSGVRAMDVAACPGGALTVSDSTLGVRVFAASGDELTRSPLDLGLPPVANGLVCY
ncbi:MAG TPA: hypothetical protein VIG06_06530 [Kofleriaceae bacterium]